MQQQHPSETQKRVNVNVRDEDDKHSTSLYATSKATMDRKQKHTANSEAHRPKKLKSGIPSYERSSVAIPSVLISTFAPGEGIRNPQHDGYNEYHEQQHHDESQHYRADHEYYAPQIQSSQSLSLPPNPPRRANTYPHFDNRGRREDHDPTLAPPRRIHSHRINQPYPPQPPSSAFESYPPHHQHHQHESQQEFMTPRSGGISPNPPIPIHAPAEDPYHRNIERAPISYVCESARTCFPATALGKRVRDEVRSMTDGTRLVPVARALHQDDIRGKGIVPDQHHNRHHHDFHPHSHPYPLRHREVNTIRLLDSTKDILETHSVLGRGTFSRVTAVTIKEPKRNEQDRPDIAHSHHLPGRRPRYYACKSIKEEILVSNVARMGKRNRNQSETYLQSVEFCVLAASQLAYEAHILSCLDHPNIVRMRGLDADGILGFEKRDHRGFFLLIDVLSETLDQKINRWRREKSLSTRNQRLPVHRQQYDDPSSSNQEVILLRRHKEKIDICLQLASALEYLHDRRVVYRDLKPPNIGFIADDWSPEQATNPPQSATRVQLFDFGLSRELTSGHQTLRGAIGTMRYMAPEVCLDSSYDCDCDIYSYSILCWELWTQKVPFEELATPDLYREQVCQRGYRPKYSPEEDPLFRHYSHEEEQYHQNYPQHRPVQTVPNEILVLLSQAWKQDPKARIRWPKIQNQFALIETLVGLQLEERELSQSTSAAVAAGIHAQAHNQFSATSFAPIAYTSRPQQQYFRHSDREEPIRVDTADSFSLRDEDFDEDLGI